MGESFLQGRDFNSGGGSYKTTSIDIECWAYAVNQAYNNYIKVSKDCYSLTTYFYDGHVYTPTSVGSSFVTKINKNTEYHKGEACGNFGTAAIVIGGFKYYMFVLMSSSYIPFAVVYTVISNDSRYCGVYLYPITPDYSLSQTPLHTGVSFSGWDNPDYVTNNFTIDYYE